MFPGAPGLAPRCRRLDFGYGLLDFRCANRSDRPEVESDRAESAPGIKLGGWLDIRIGDQLPITSISCTKTAASGSRTHLESKDLICAPAFKKF